ncbi:hypothetical protein [Zoogloea sp.]|uniref:hypothetical protein n=1 Tax=Zoogloea sp. TaxID=49181 RepID=UPI0035B0A5E4
MHPLLQQLSGGDRRSIGEADRVAARVAGAPALLAVLFEGLDGDDSVLRMRCADVIEKATAARPALLVPWKDALIQRHALVTQAEVRWHVAPLLARLPLTPAEADAVVARLLSFTQDRSRIVRTMSMQALVDIGLRHRHLLPDIARHIRELTVTGTPAMKARGRRLIDILERASGG